MHPAFIWYWKRRHATAAACGSLAYADCGSDHPRWRDEGIRVGRRGWDDDPVIGASGLGARRPLRFLASRLELSQEQFSQVAKLLEELKIERAQASVDLRRTSAAMAEALEGERFDAEKADAARQQRLEAARRVQEAVTRTLAGIHALLDAEQRSELAGLIRGGGLRL